MGLDRRSFLGVAAAAGLAGCTGDDGDEGSADDTTDGSTDGSDETTATVQVTETEAYGEILTGPDGETLYLFESDEQGAGVSTCQDGCADSWPPLTAEGDPTAGEGVGTALDAFEREDGDTQVTANGWPLYYYSNDEAPGDIEGQGVNDVWFVLDATGTPVREASDDSGSDGGRGPEY